jgi:lipoate-protein ligase A
MPERTQEDWLLWQDSSRPAAMNMALDEALLLTAPARQQPILRFYGWDAPETVSIGYVQKATAVPTGRPFVRRPTGGGVVYHDHDFTYSVAVPAGHWLTGLDRTRSYDWINRSVQTGLRSLRLSADLADQEIAGHVDRATMVCFSNPTKYDLLLGERKVAGSAQRRTRDGILHQGSLHFGGPLPVAREEMAEALASGFVETMRLRFSPFVPDELLLTFAAALAEEKYAATAWNCKR